jgi:sterol desaturase/sphingolipid hydroxylase (fatty acid hydroxylase superfamily)
MLLIDPLSAAWFAAFVAGHYFVWNKFHELMHFYTSPWYLRLPGAGAWYRYVEYFHFLHHQHRDKNFNAFLPLWDLLLGTQATETPLDQEVWRRVNLGEYVDRRGVPMLQTNH